MTDTAAPKRYTAMMQKCPRGFAAAAPECLEYSVNCVELGPRFWIKRCSILAAVLIPWSTACSDGTSEGGAPSGSSSSSVSQASSTSGAGTSGNAGSEQSGSFGGSQGANASGSSMLAMANASNVGGATAGVSGAGMLAAVGGSTGQAGGDANPVMNGGTTGAAGGGAGGMNGGPGAGGANAGGMGGMSGGGAMGVGGAMAIGGAMAVGGDSATGGMGGASEDPGADLLSFADGFQELFIHDECTGANPSQPDTCIHEQQHEEAFSFGGESGTTYAVTLRVRGLFEPTNITGGQTPDPGNPYFKVGGMVNAADYSQWHIEVSDPAQTYWLNHYPQTSHTIYQEDFEITVPINGGADVAVRVVDGNDREIDNSADGLADRRQLIDGVTDQVLDGQVLRLDVIDVTVQ